MDQRTPTHYDTLGRCPAACDGFKLRPVSALHVRSANGTPRRGLSLSSLALTRKRRSGVSVAWRALATRISGRGWSSRFATPAHQRLVAFGSSNLRADLGGGTWTRLQALLTCIRPVKRVLWLDSSGRACCAASGCAYARRLGHGAWYAVVRSGLLLHASREFSVRGQRPGASQTRPVWTAVALSSA